MPPPLSPMTHCYDTAIVAPLRAPGMAPMKTTISLLSLILLTLAFPLLAAGVVYEGGQGPGNGKHIVLVSGDEEYRSEEALPQLGKILAKHHGFKCTVLFAIDPKDGT